MQNERPTPELRKYRVQVGFTRITVEGSSPEDALERARRQLCVELPRMWDVLQSMDNSRFIVEPLK